MSKFAGFKCDECGSIWVGDSLIRVLLTFTFATGGTDTYAKDLCPACLGTEYPPPEEWIMELPKPPKQAKKKSVIIEPTAIPGLEEPV